MIILFKRSSRTRETSGGIDFLVSNLASRTWTASVAAYHITKFEDLVIHKCRIIYIEVLTTEATSLRTFCAFRSTDRGPRITRAKLAYLRVWFHGGMKLWAFQTFGFRFIVEALVFDTVLT